MVRLSNPARESQLREIAEKAAQLSLLQAGSRPEQIAVAEAAVVTAQTRLEHARRQLAEAEALRTEQLHMILAEAEKAGSVQWYNTERGHSACGDLPPAWEAAPPESTTIRQSDVVCTTRLGGLLKNYQRRAA